MTEHKSEAFREGVHPCEEPNCREYIAYDDEPYCFKHSPDSGSTLPGYSYVNETWPDKK